MKSKSKSIVLNYWYKNQLPFEKGINFFSDFFTSKGQPFEEIGYTIIDKSSRYCKRKSRNVKFTEKNLAKFYHIAEEYSALRASIVVEMLRLLPNWEFKSRDIEVSVGLSPHPKADLTSLEIILNSERWNSHDLDDLIVETFNFLTTRRMKVVYGFFTILENTKNPSFYMSGILNENMTIEEKKAVQIWAENQHLCENQVWDIFEGKIITAKHLNREGSLDQLNKVMTETGLVKLSEDCYYLKCCTSSDNVDSIDVKKRKALLNMINSMVN